MLRRHRMGGEKIVFTNGCFDLLHAGHLEILRAASKMGDVLVVGINSDKSVAPIKGPGRPIISQVGKSRTRCSPEFCELRCCIRGGRPLLLIEEVRPDVLVKGEDWRGKEVVGADIVKARGGTVRFVKYAKGVSTTDLIQKIRGD